MSKLAPYLSDIHATLIGMYARQQLYVERMNQCKAEAKMTAKLYNISFNDAISKMKAAQEEEAAARADLAALHEELRERTERLLVKNDEMTKDWPNAKLCEALGDTYNPGEFDNPFQMEMWMKQAGM